MKQLLCICFLFLCVSINAHAQDAEPLEFSEVVQATGVSKDELYNRAKNWVVRVYNNPQKVIQLDDRTNGQISVKGLFTYPFRGCKNNINYTLSLYVKEGRYKFEMHDIYFTAFGSAGNQIDFGLLTPNPEVPKMRGYIRGTMQKLWHEAQLKSEQYSTSVLESLKTAMSTETETQSDDW